MWICLIAPGSDQYFDCVRSIVWITSVIIATRVFPGRLTSRGTFINRLLFSLLFSGNFCGGDKALMEGDKVMIGGIPVPPLGKTLTTEIFPNSLVQSILPEIWLL